MDIELLLEAERRGILPPDKKALLDEARRRGLVPDSNTMPQQSQPDLQPNADGTYGQPPDGFVLNPNTGQMTSREMLANNMQPNAATSAAVGATQGLSFGFGDEAIGAMNAAIPGPGTAAERYAFGREYMRAENDAAKRDHGGARGAGEIGGAMATVLSPVSGLSGAAKGAGLLPRVGASAVDSAALSGLYGFGAGEGGASERANNAMGASVTGALMGAAIPLAGAGVQRVLDNRAAKAAIRKAARGAPSTDDLLAEGQRLYGDIDRAGVAVRADRAKSMAQDIVDDLSYNGAGRPGASLRSPASRAAFKDAESYLADWAGGDPVPFRDLDQMRRTFGQAATANLANPNDTRVASSAINAVDDFVRNLGPGDVDAGDVQLLQSLLPKARDVWARMSRSQLIDDAIMKAENYPSGAASGIRNQFRSILNNPKLSRGFSDAEKEAMRRVINGTVPEQMLHLFGGGLGQFATTGMGAAAGGAGGLPGMLAGGAAGAAVGSGVRRASEALARKNAEIVRALIANGGLKQLPKASPQARDVLEALLRRNLAMGAGG